MAAKKEKSDTIDSAAALLDHLMEEAGVDPAQVRKAAVGITGKNAHDVEIVLNETFYGRERALVLALLLAIDGGA